MFGGILKSRPHSETAKRRNLCWNGFNDGWYGEIAAVVFSLACSIAIVVILLVYNNNNPTPKLPKGLTLNAMVSILATASKAASLFTTSSCLGQLKWLWFRAEQPRSLAHAQLFDDASRGPLGALFLFFSGPRKSIASLGAILTLLALAYDPFVQQVINISPEVRYSLSNDVTTKQATRLVMSPCDLSSNLIFNDTDFTLEDLEDERSSVADRTCRLISESGHSQGVTIGALTGGLWSYSIHELPFFQITTEFEPNPQSNHSGTTSDSARFPWGGRVPMGEWAMTYFKVVDWSLAVDSVSTCTLDLCLRDYQVTVTGGTTRVVASNERFGRRYYRGAQDFMEITNEGRWGSTGYLCWEPEGTPKNSSWKYELEGDRYVSPSYFAFCINFSDSFWHWSGMVVGALVGNWTTNVDIGWVEIPQNGTWLFNSTDMPLHYLTAAGDPVTSYNGSLTLSYLDDTDEQLESTYNETLVRIVTVEQSGLETVMSNIAASLTQLGLQDPSTNDITGMTGTVEAVVHVRWEWLALPGFLLIGVALFLIVTVFLNKCSRTPVWKSSANALLYHGLEEDLKENAELLLTASSMSNMAGSTTVSLTMSEKSARFVLATAATPAAIQMRPIAPSRSEQGDVSRQAVPGATTT